jgi:hypothetical protein
MLIQTSSLVSLLALASFSAAPADAHTGHANGRSAAAHHQRRFGSAGASRRHALHAPAEARDVHGRQLPGTIAMRKRSDGSSCKVRPSTSKTAAAAGSSAAVQPVASAASSQVVAVASSLVGAATSAVGAVVSPVASVVSNILAPPPAATSSASQEAEDKPETSAQAPASTTSVWVAPTTTSVRPFLSRARAVLRFVADFFLLFPLIAWPAFLFVLLSRLPPLPLPPRPRRAPTPASPRTATRVRRLASLDDDQGLVADCAFLLASLFLSPPLAAGISAGDCFDHFKDHIGWWYDWTPNPSGHSANGVTAVSMLWGGGTADGTDASRLADFRSMSWQPQYVLGFEEPDCKAGSGSADMSQQAAAKLWNELIVPHGNRGALLGSPSMCSASCSSRSLSTTPPACHR